MRTRLVAAAFATLLLLAAAAHGAGGRSSVVTATVIVSVAGGGRVQSEPPGAIDCGSRCTVEAEVASTLVLRVIPDGGRELAGWDGACAGRAARCELVVDGPTTVSASFAPVQPLPTPKTLNVTRSEGGTVASDPPGLIACGSSCSASWSGGEEVTLRASAAAGFRFLGWYGACSGSDTACRVRVDETRDVTAVFLRDPLPPGSYRLTLRNRNPPGSGDVDGTVVASWSNRTLPCFDAVCTSEPIPFGTNVTVTADSGQLDAWSGGCVGTANPCRLVIGGDVEVGVGFRPVGPPPSFGVNVARSGLGAVTSRPNGIECPPSPSCAAAFGATTRVQLTADPRDGWLFAGWRGDCTGTEGCSVLADTTRTVVAVFRVVRQTLRVELAGRGRGTVRSSPGGIACPPDCSFAFPRGDAVTLEPSPAPGSLFTGWTGDCTGPSCTVTVSAPRAARARFDRCASLDFRGFVAKQPRARQLRVSLVLTGPASVRIAVLRARATVKGLRTGRLAAGTRTVSLALPPRATGRHTLRVTVTDACGRTKARARTVGLR